LRIVFWNRITFISTQNMSWNCVQVWFKTRRNWCTKLFEFFFASVEILGSFDGFIHIHNWVVQNMDNSHFLENQNMNLDIWNVDIQNLNIQNMEIRNMNL
jgi:hypothetical protein